jgi:hypothetical protein
MDLDDDDLDLVLSPARGFLIDGRRWQDLEELG